MKRTNLTPKLIVFLTVLISAFCFIPTVQSGVPPFISQAIEETQRIKYWEDSTISASKESWFLIGVGYIPEEIEKNWFPKNPYKIKLYINGEEITMQRYAVYQKNWEVRIPYKDYLGEWKYNGPIITTKLHAWYWYTFFEPGFFEPGDYEIKVEIWVYGSYGGSEEEVWRIFENKIGPTDWLYGYDAIGKEWIWSSVLCVTD